MSSEQRRSYQLLASSLAHIGWIHWAQLSCRAAAAAAQSVLSSKKKRHSSRNVARTNELKGRAPCVRQRPSKLFGLRTTTPSAGHRKNNNQATTTVPYQ